MRYRLLGRTNLTVSVIGLGTWQYGGEWGVDYSNRDVAAIVNRAGELGVNLIDTAECYGDHRSERLIGEAVRGSRDRWIIATKFGHWFHGFMDRSRHFALQEVLKQLDASLMALGAEYIDIYQSHSPFDDELFQDDLWAALLKEVEKGKIRHLGISISKNNEVKQTEAAARLGAEVIQVVYNRLDRGPEDGVFQSCMRQNAGVLARVPLASGYLSGKYKPGQTFPAADVRSTHDQENVLKKLQEAQRIAEHEVPAGVSMPQWALAWCLKHPAVAAVIPGSKNPQQLEMNVGAAALLQDGHPLETAIHG
ncbi:MAG TPA: aldo/keto reductase [Chitinivibrionales bacterium]